MSVGVVILLIIIIVPLVLGGLYFMGLPPFDTTERAIRLQIENRDLDINLLRKYIERDIVGGELGDTITVKQAKRLKSGLDLSDEDLIVLLIRELRVIPVGYECPSRAANGPDAIKWATKYVLDTKGKCVASECVDGYVAEEGECIPTDIERALRLQIENRDLDINLLRRYIEQDIVGGELGDTITVEQAERLKSGPGISDEELLELLFRGLRVIPVGYECSRRFVTDPVPGGAKYVVDTAGNCVVSECVSGYAVEDSECIPQ